MNDAGARPRAGAKAVTWDYDWLNANFTDETACYELTAKEVAILLTPLSRALWSTRWWNPPEDFSQIVGMVADLQNKLISPVDCAADNGGNGGNGGETSFTKFCSSFEALIDIDCEDDMPKHDVVFRNGQAYVQVDCGCDEPLLYPLGNPVTFNADGAPVSADDGGEYGGNFQVGADGSGSVWQGSVGSENEDCYAQAATAYMLQRAQEFFYAVIDWYIIGSGVKTAQNVKYINFAKLAPFLSFGNKAINYIAAVGRTAVDAVLADPALTTSLESAWNFTGSVNRDQLYGWVYDGCPPTVAGFSASVMLKTWLDYSIIPAYNADLVELASNCESGLTPGTGFEFEWAREYDFLESVNTFIPGTGTDAVWSDGFGWGSGAASGNWAIEIHKDMTGIEITGYQIHLSRAMSGPYERVRIGTAEDNGNVIQDTEDLTDEIITLALNYTFANQMYFFVNEDTTGTGLFDAFIEKIVLFGNGTPPAGGTPILG